MVLIYLIVPPASRFRPEVDTMIDTETESDTALKMCSVFIRDI